MPRLILDPGKPTERKHTLAPGANTIGRSSDNPVFVLHKSLSRRHARIIVSESDVVIEDLASRNGTFVDGVRIQRHTLRAAHYIKCGDVLFSFYNDAVGDEEAVRPAVGPTLVCHAAPHIDLAAGHDPRMSSSERSLGALTLSARDPAERARERLELLLEVSRLLALPMELDALLARVLELLFAVLDVDRGVMLMVGDDRDPRCVDDLQARVTRARRGEIDVRGFYSRHVVHWVLERRTAVLFADALRDAPAAAGGSIVAQSICGAMCAPLRARDHLLGVLYVDNLTTANRFGEEDLEFLSAFASHAAVAIERAMLARKLEAEAVKRRSLQRFFPPSAVDAIVARGEDPWTEPIETEATLLFCDISDFTALSSRMRPREIITLLNEYFPLMAACVFAHEGTLEKYIGDALLAVWGVPVMRPDDALRAVRAAIDMQAAIGEWNLRRAEPLSIHVGIASGGVAAGNIGSADYLQLATIGDATNLASRVCGVADAGAVVIDDHTRARIGVTAPDLAFEHLGPTVVKGKREPLALYRARRLG